MDEDVQTENWKKIRQSLRFMQKKCYWKDNGDGFLPFYSIKRTERIYVWSCRSFLSLMIMNYLFSSFYYDWGERFLTIFEVKLENRIFRSLLTFSSSFLYPIDNNHLWWRLATCPYQPIMALSILVIAPGLWYFLYEFLWITLFSTHTIGPLITTSTTRHSQEARKYIGSVSY